MAGQKARVRDGVLTYRDAGTECALPMDSTEWTRWIEAPTTRTFRFEHGPTSFTARREQQRGHWYWYAYRRRDGRLRKAYLGRAPELTLARLVDVCIKLDAPAETPASGESRPPAPVRSGDRHNLPVELSSFLGRQTEFADLQRLLPTTRLLTLTGAGGVGKTRLAQHLAAALLDAGFDSAWMVDLSAVTDPTLVPQAVAQALGTYEQPDRPLIDTLTAALTLGRTLLLLDNCEHLIDPCARLTETLLKTCPTLRILATSREPLRLPGEIAWRVPSLSVPSSRFQVPSEGAPDLELRTPNSELNRSEAVQLFVARAQTVQTGFALTERNAPAVAEICRRLDGIPLAIELAAARVHVLSPEDLIDRLDDRFRLLAGGSRTAPPRQQTLRATVEWSYDLLTEPERRLFERLAVFAGGFTLDAVEAVRAAGGVDAADLLDLLTRLVDRSLVLVEQSGTEATRYRLLETLRAYAVDRLTERGESEHWRSRHARWMADLAQQAERSFHGPEQARWLRWADRERDNANAALAWAIERGEVDIAVRLAAPLTWPWLIYQQWSEGLAWSRRVLTLSEGASTRERGMLLVGAVQLALFRADLASNRPSGDLESVRQWIVECLTIGELLSDDYLILASYGIAHLLREHGVEIDGFPDVTADTIRELALRAGDTWGRCRGLEESARQALRAGDRDGALERLSEAARLSRETGDTFSLAMTLNQLGDVERSRGAHARAGDLYQESMVLFAELGLGPQPNIIHNLGYVALAAGDRIGAAAHFQDALGRFRRLGEQRGMAECLIGLGAVAAAGGRVAGAARLFGAGEAALKSLGTHLWVSNEPDYIRWLTRARSGRSIAEFDRVRAEGRTLTLEQAVAFAVDTDGTRSDASLRTPPASTGLTPRECEVARLVAQGLTNRQIAASLVIADKTAANHVQHVLDKLDLHSRTQLAAHATALGLDPA